LAALVLLAAWLVGRLGPPAARQRVAIAMLTGCG